MKFIGDVHCKIGKYIPIIRTCEESIQVGDFGFKEEWDWLEKNSSIIGLSHKINMGNHDYIPCVNTNPHSLGNWSYERGIFTIRGANSIDIHKRIEGRDWFVNEELNYGEGYEVFDNWELSKPDIVVTHDCPALVAEVLFGFPRTGINKEYYKSTTRELLQNMFEVHQPKLWVFGHHHINKNETINGTNFICLGELETLDI